MKKRTLIFVLILLAFSASSYAQEDPRLPLMKQRARETAKIVLDYHAEVLADEYSSFVFEKYITGADLSINTTIKAIYLRNEKVNGEVLSYRIAEENIDIAEFQGQISEHLKSMTAKHFAYNLKRPFKATLTDKALIFGSVATDKSDPSDDKILFASNKSFKDHKDSSDGLRSFMLEIVTYLSTTTYIRTQKETISKIEIKVPEERVINGAFLKYKRLGPGYNQTDIEEEVEIEANKNRGSLENVVTGDYAVSLENLFCGCEAELQEAVIDTRSEIKSEEHKFVLEDMELTTIFGTIFSDKEQQFPLANEEVKLIPACDGADECMYKIEPVKTNEIGEFEFKNVPKGSYLLYCKKQELGDVKNCNFQQKEFNAGDFNIEDKRYDIFVTYHAPGFAHVELVWEKAKIRFLDDGDEMQVFDRTAYIQSGGNGQNPTGTDGKPLDVPFVMDIPGYGKITSYGAPENNIPKVISIYSLGAYEGHARFKIMKTEEALNMCEITQRGDGPVYLDLSFDLFAGGPEANTDWIQHTVSCIEDNVISEREKGTLINRSPYPTAFEQITITEADIIYFKGFDEVDKTLSNGRATLKIEFKLSEEYNN